MAALINALIKALDSIKTPKQVGENAHLEYGWSTDIKERIVQFSFQITRTNKIGVDKLSNILNNLLVQLKNLLQTGTLHEKEIARGHLSILYRMIGHTRDIVDGKGEYTLAYMMVYVWQNHFLELAMFALKCFFVLDDKTIHQYGSWKDIKYFCKYCENNGVSFSSPIIQYAITLVNDQLKKDLELTTSLENNSKDISLASKWVPREKSAFGSLYEHLAKNYFCEFLETPRTNIQMSKAVLKCKTEYRKVLSLLNRRINTLQVKQCEQTWTNIDFNKVTSISLSKQKKAFLNINKNGEVRHPLNEDRIVCAENFNAHIQRAVKGEIEMKGKRVGMADFTKQALELVNTDNDVEKNLLNSQWRDNATQTGTLGKMIAMVDVSGSMGGDPMNVAIALGIRIAEKSLLGNRVMTFSSNPTWVNLDGCSDFVSKVKVVSSADWGMNTNFHAALDMILDAIIQNKIGPQDVQDMVLVILSDMQMDAGDICNKDTLYTTMEKKYAEAGVRVQGVPYKPPHILFWNLRSTNGFPSLANQMNTSMMSGFSPSLLNMFCEQGLTALQSCTPWSLLKNTLENDRYTIMGNFIDIHIIV